MSSGELAERCHREWSSVGEWHGSSPHTGHLQGCGIRAGGRCDSLASEGLCRASSGRVWAGNSVLAPARASAALVSLLGLCRAASAACSSPAASPSYWTRRAGRERGASSCGFVLRVQGCWRPVNDAELCRGCSRMRLLVLSAHVVPALWQLRHCKGRVGKNRGLTSDAPLLCSASTLFMLFPLSRQGSSGKCFDLLLSRAAPTPTPKPAPCSRPSQPSLPR